MKTTLLFVLAAVLLCATGWAYFSYTSQPPAVELSVMRDRTDIFLAQPDASEVFTLQEIDKHKWEPLRFRAQTISNYDYNPVYVAELAPSFVLLANPKERDNEVAKYKRDVQKAIDSINLQQNSLPQSSVYVPIIREVNRLAGSKAKTKIMVNYSDLGENTATFSIYKVQFRSLIKYHPDSVRKLFEKLAKPGDLHGVIVYFIFKPQTDSENENFMLMSGLFQKILESAGAQVHVGSNIVAE